VPEPTDVIASRARRDRSRDGAAAGQPGASGSTYAADSATNPQIRNGMLPILGDGDAIISFIPKNELARLEHAA
jgi:hypothetical protein